MPEKKLSFGYNSHPETNISGYSLSGTDASSAVKSSYASFNDSYNSVDIRKLKKDQSVTAFSSEFWSFAKRVKVYRMTGEPVSLATICSQENTLLVFLKRLPSNDSG